MTRRHFPAWLAILALLTHLLAMSTASLSADTRTQDGEHLQTGHAHGHAEPAATTLSEHHGAGHAGMLQCCCAGFTGLAALPFEPPRLPELLVRQAGLLPEQPPAVPLPRDQWPALNPRASPFA